MIENIAEKKLEIIIGLFLLGGIIAWLIIPTSFQDTTIILEGGGGGAPVSCLPSGGLVLAQNLTDLCDVTIISPLTSQIIEYNGSQWINVNSTSFTDTTQCNNIGVGNAFVCVEGTNVNLRSILNGTGIIISNDTNTITVTNSLPEATTAINLGTEIPLDAANVFKQEVGNELQFKTIFSWDTNTLTFENWNATHIRIRNTAPESTTCDNQGSFGEGVGVGATSLCDLRKLIGIKGIVLSGNSTSIIFNTNFANGTGISITGTTTQTFTNTGVTSLTSADTATLSYNASTGNVLATPTLKKLCEFTGVGGETSIACTFSSSQQVFEVQVHYNSTVTNTVWVLRFNNDTGSNYSLRSSTNGGADAVVVGQAFFSTQTITENLMNSYILTCHDHAPTYEKWCNGDRTTMTNGSGAGTAPARVELYGKWADRTSDITSINLTRTASTGTLNSSHIIVWGYS